MTDQQLVDKIVDLFDAVIDESALDRLSEEELKQKGWKPFELNILKQDLDRFIDSDGDIINLGHKVFLQKEKVTYVENLVKIMSNKIWNIRATIDWIKFTQGQLYT